MWVYIVWIETRCVRYDKWAKQNVSRVSRGKAYLRKLAVTICHDSSHFSHMLSICFTSRDLRKKATYELPAKTCLVFNCLESSHSLSHTTLTIKSHIKYKVQKIEHNYNQIGTELKPTQNSCKSQLYNFYFHFFSQSSVVHI